MYSVGGDDDNGEKGGTSGMHLQSDTFD